MKENVHLRKKQSVEAHGLRAIGCRHYGGILHGGFFYAAREHEPLPPLLPNCGQPLFHVCLLGNHGIALQGNTSAQALERITRRPHDERGVSGRRDGIPLLCQAYRRLFAHYLVLVPCVGHRVDLGRANAFEGIFDDAVSYR